MTSIYQSDNLNINQIYCYLKHSLAEWVTQYQHSV